MQREIENDRRLTKPGSARSSEPPLDQEFWEAWHHEIGHELGVILERLEALDLSGPALHIECAIEALRMEKP